MKTTKDRDQLILPLEGQNQPMAEGFAVHLKKIEAKVTKAQEAFEIAQRLQDKIAKEL